MKIGNNVFIGMNTIILKGVHIGNNVIIGAGSVVTKSIPDNTVAAGNPCNVLMSLDEYYRKRRSVQFAEAEELVRKYRERYGKEPDEKALYEFFWLFCNVENELTPDWEKMMRISGNESLSYEKLKMNNKQFDSMDEFLKNVK